MKFPENIEIQVVSKQGSLLPVENLVCSIVLFAPEKNNYHLGPFFSSARGIINIKEDQLRISAEAVLESGIMDYVHYSKCLDRAMIEFLDSGNIEKLIVGRSMWGLIKDEHLLYGSEENLMKKILLARENKITQESFYIDFKGQDNLKINMAVEVLK